MLQPAKLLFHFQIHCITNGPNKSTNSCDEIFGHSSTDHPIKMKCVHTGNISDEFVFRQKKCGAGKMTQREPSDYAIKISRLDHKRLLCRCSCCSNEFEKFTMTKLFKTSNISDRFQWLRMKSTLPKSIWLVRNWECVPDLFLNKLGVCFAGAC